VRKSISRIDSDARAGDLRIDPRAKPSSS
jgi:hypothetical protein